MRTLLSVNVCKSGVPIRQRARDDDVKQTSAVAMMHSAIRSICPGVLSAPPLDQIFDQGLAPAPDLGKQV
jgi:hypothetical protein